MTSNRLLDSHRAGIGLRLPHLSEMVATRPSIGWLEIHPENFIANPHASELLVDLARTHPISVHTVGVSVGSAEGVDRKHLSRVRALVDAIDPVLVSGHLAWSTHQGEYLNDLLPLPYTDESLQLIGGHIQYVQDVLGKRFLLENPSSYVRFATSTMSEAEFLGELVRRTGCGLLCDVSNVHLSAHNMGYDARTFLDSLPADAIEELHLGGFTPEADESKPGAELLVDTHGTSVADPSWELYAYAIRRFGPRPTLIEWDNDLPSLATLLAEAAHAERLAMSIVSDEATHAIAR